MKRFKIFTVIFLCFFNFFFIKTSKAQSLEPQLGSMLPNVIPASPSASQMTKYGNYEVTMFNGLPDITIPIYTISSGGIELPITISYHASGIKVGQSGGYVGLGWLLNAGGGITREVHGLPDELGDNYLSGTVPVPALGSLDILSENTIEFLENVNRHRYDVEPDIFSYNVNGKSGKFFFNCNNNYAPVFIPYAPMQVNWKMPALELVDEKGLRYEFRDTELGSNTIVTGSTPITTAWKLNEIITPDQANNIQLSYVVGGSSQYDYSDTQTVSDQGNNISFGDNGYDGDLQGGNFLSLPDDGLTITNEYVTSEQLVSQITFKNGKVVFNYATSNQESGSSNPLNSIQVYTLNPENGAYQLIKTIQLVQSYFTYTDANNNVTKRLRLDTLKFEDSHSTIVQKYSFAYNNTLQLPAKLSRAIDYWGYFNNQTGNTTLIPGQTVPYGVSQNGTITVGGSPTGRNPDPTHMQANILTQVNYPTGGYSIFNYETNQYADANGNAQYAGGLRVQSILSYDGINPTPITKTYKYGTNESGLGRANFFLSNYFFNTTQLSRFFYVGTGDAYPDYGNIGLCYWMAYKRTRTFLSSSILQLDGLDGSPVVYPTVTEYLGNGTTNIGKTIYTFTDMPDQAGLDAYQVSTKPIITSYQYLRGKVQSKTIYKANGDGTYTEIENIQNTYGAFAPTQYNNVGFICYKINANSGSFPNALGTDEGDLPSWDETGCAALNDSYGIYLSSPGYSYTWYNLNSGDAYLTKTVDQKFYSADLTQSVTKTTSYTYGDFTHQQPTQETVTSSTGDTYIAQYKYPNDFNTQAPYNTMVGTMHLLSPVVEQLEYKNNTSNFLSAEITNYGIFNNNALQVYPASKETMIGNENFEPRLQYNAYDSFGNLTDVSKVNGPHVSYQWGYNSEYPIAECSNATANEFYFNGYEESTSSGIPGHTGNNCSTSPVITWALPDSKTYVISYWYLTSGGWQYSGELSYVPQSSGNGVVYQMTGGTAYDDVRIYPSGSQMTTFTYNPLVGMTSSTDPKGETTYYEYDNFQRLMNIKDKDGNVIKHMTYHYKGQ